MVADLLTASYQGELPIVANAALSYMASRHTETFTSKLKNLIVSGDHQVIAFHVYEAVVHALHNNNYWVA